MTILLSSCQSGNAQGTDQVFLLYVGSYGKTSEEGILVYQFNTVDGSLKFTSIAKGIRAASYQAIHPSGNFLYSVNETSDFEGKKSGAISAFTVDRQSGKLEFINQKSSGGMGPCYVSVDQSGQYVFAANYRSGSFSMLPIGPNGGLADYVDLKQSLGPKPHGHAIVVGPENQYALAADLGTDEVKSFKIDLAQGKLIDGSVYNTVPGSGPRHLVVHQNGRLVFVGMELNSTVSAYTFNDHDGSLTQVALESTLPSDFSGKNSVADIHLSPDGKFLYVSNRGHNSIAIFSIDQQSGDLTPVGHHPSGGIRPRNFVIDPTGKYLLAANRESNNVVVFRIDPATGQLSATDSEISINQPVCLKFLSIKNQ